MRFARYVRLTTDSQGESRFEDVEVPLAPRESTLSAEPLFGAPFQTVDGSAWLGAPGGWDGQVTHPAAQRQVYCTIQGEYEITTSEGEVRCFPAGSILLIEDTSGLGHKVRITNDRGALILVLSVAEAADGSWAV